MLKAAHTTAKTAVLYLRRSTDRQDQSIEKQRRVCLEFARATGLEVVAEYVDDAVSGTSTKGRKQFLRMMADAEAPGCQFEFVIVYDVSRFSRDPDEDGHYRWALRQLGIEVLYATSGFKGDRSDGPLRCLRQSEASQKSIDLSRDTLEGLSQRAGGGWWGGGIPPYGYDLEFLRNGTEPYMTIRYHAKDTKEITDHFTGNSRVVPVHGRAMILDTDRCRLALSTPERVALIQRIFDMYTREGKGFRRITCLLNQEGVPSPTGGQWSVGTIRVIITNRIYTGCMVWNRRTDGKFHRVLGGKVVARGTSEYEVLMINGSGDWVVVEGAHPAIVAREQFQEAQRLLKERRESRGAEAYRHGRAMNSAFLLSGLMRCTRCGHNLIGESIGSSKVRKDGTRIITQYYVCAGYKSKGNAACARAAVRIEQMHEGILSGIRDRVDALLSAGGLRQLREIVVANIRSGIPDIKAEIAATQRLVDETDAKLDNLLESLPRIGKEAIERKIVELTERRKAQEERLRELEAMKQEEVDVDVLANDILATVKGFEDLFPYGTPEEKKEFIRLWVDHIDFEPEKRRARVYIKRFPAPS
jgi:DNA invertase Pin-like site-specific DNA recombinase